MAKANPSDVHRVLRLPKPRKGHKVVYMSGPDVKTLQVAVNARLKTYGLSSHAVKADGVFGPLTADACWRADYRLGCAWTTCRDAQPQHGGLLAQSGQRAIRHYRHRTPTQLARARWRARHIRKPTGPTVMFDSVTLDQIPTSAQAVAGYVAGRFPTFVRLAALFPHARRVSIAVASTQDAQVVDCEPGDATPATTVNFVKRRLAEGHKLPAVYCSVSQVRDVLAHLAAAGIKRSQIKLWTAHFTGKPHICTPRCGNGMPTTADATQWTDRALGRNLDESLVTPNWWR